MNCLTISTLDFVFCLKIRISKLIINRKKVSKSVISQIFASLYKKITDIGSK